MRDLISAAEAVERAEALRFVDCSFYLPTMNKDAAALFAASHIPGAVFLDINAVADVSSSLPHMMPDAQTFGAAMGALGLGPDDAVVVYDQLGLFSAARGWLTFKQFGHASVSVLDGGLPAWIAAGGSVTDKPTSIVPTDYEASVPGASLMVSAAQVSQRLADGQAVVDARPAGRFSGQDPEPRPGMRGGHMPGALNLPHSQLLTADAKLRPTQELRAAFEDAGVNLAGPITTTCGSGVTASVLSFALYQLGITAQVYDGSWAEWGDPQFEFPIATG